MRRCRQDEYSAVYLHLSMRRSTDNSARKRYMGPFALKAMSDQLIRPLSTLERVLLRLSSPLAWFIVNTRLGSSLHRWFSAPRDAGARAVKRRVEGLLTVDEFRIAFGEPVERMQGSDFSCGNENEPGYFQPHRVERYFVHSYYCDVWLDVAGKVVFRQVVYFDRPFWWHVALSLAEQKRKSFEARS